MHTNDCYLSNFVHSDAQIVFTMTFEYTIYERSRRAVLHSLDYDVNIEKKKKKYQKVISFRGIFAPSDDTYKPLAEKSRDCKDSDFSQWQHGNFCRSKRTLILLTRLCFMIRKQNM